MIPSVGDYVKCVKCVMAMPKYGVVVGYAPIGTYPYSVKYDDDGFIGLYESHELTVIAVECIMGAFINDMVVI